MAIRWVFSVLESVLSKPAYHEPDRVFSVDNDYSGGSGGGENLGRMSNPATYVLYAERADVFEHLALTNSLGVNFGFEEEVLRSRGLRITKQFFDLVGMAPVAGRYFEDEDFESEVSVLSSCGTIMAHKIWWRSRYCRQNGYR